ncbi:MAG TPA: polymer-forming cytoskeletal protein [Myxococcales bacterium]|nr:polymer-forming cytoskeletal protein [Myxococcales bacterium]
MVLLALSLFFGSNASGGALAGRVVDHMTGHGALSRALDKVSLHFGPGPIVINSDDEDSNDDSDEEPAEPAEPPAAPATPTPPHGIHITTGKGSFHFDVGDSPGAAGSSGSEDEAAKITVSGKNLATVDALHRIAQAGGWSMTLVGSPKEKIDLDVKNVEPRVALKALLEQSGALGVLKGDKLVVVASPDANAKGTLIEQTGSRHSMRSKTHGRKNNNLDVVRVFQGDVTIEEGKVVQGDVVCIGGSIELQPGVVVQGDAVAVGGSVEVHKGALVLGEAVAVMGHVDVERGAQVMGDHLDFGPGQIFPGPSHTRGKSGWLTGLGPFGLFPTMALFALIYLVGLVILRMWPERVRNVGHAMFENPVRSFTVGFLCWLLLLPLSVLLAISIVGIPLILLLPLAIFLSIVIGVSSFALKVGESLPAGPGQRFVPPAALGMGMMVLLLMAFVPWLGISMLALLQFFALGASVGSRFGRALPPHV